MNIDRSVEINPSSGVDTFKHRWPVSLSIVLIFGLFYGYIWWTTYYNGASPRLYQFSTNDPMWIASGVEAPQAYFRKELYIPQEVTNAWIYLTAPDNFQAFINGEEIGSKNILSVQAGGIYDVTKEFVAGRNVIAVSVHRKSYPGSAQIAVRGGYIGVDGTRHTFTSDDTWKVAIYEERSGTQNFPWYSLEFVDWEWESTQRVGKKMEPSAVSVPPELYFNSPKGKWIWSSNAEARSAYFEKNFNAPTRPKDAWIRISADQNFELYVNDIHMGGRNFDAGTYNLYNITSYLRAGSNTIGVGVHGESPNRALLLDVYLVSDMFSGFMFKSDSSWRSIAWTASDDTLPSPEDSRWKPAVILGDYTALPWGLLVKTPQKIITPPTHQMLFIFTMLFIISSWTGFFVFLWWMWGRLIHRVTGLPFQVALSQDAMIHLVPLLLILMVYMLRFDIRFDPSYPFSPAPLYFAIITLLLLKLALFLTAFFRSTWRDVPKPLENKSRWSGARRFGTFAGFLLLLGVGLTLRIGNLNDQTLTHDEVDIVTYTQGILERGYPSKVVGPRVKPIGTYEVLPFPIAISVMLFGMTDFTVRLPAVIFGTATIALIYYIGMVIFNRRTAFLSALIYALCPWSILWSRNAFYPQQAQFCALLTTYLFYRAIGDGDIKPKYLYGAVGAFILTYLSWEGSGFIILGLFVGLLCIKGRDWTWIRNRHLWYAVGIAGLAVFFQQARRMLIQNPYLIVGTGKSDIGLPTLAFLDPMYDPLFYINKFFLLENHVVLTIVAVLGIPFIFRHQGLKYFTLLLFSLPFLMNNLLPAVASRYAYYLQPYLVIVSSAVIIQYVDLVLGMGRRYSTPFLRWVKIFVGIALPAIVFLSSNTFVLKMYRLSSTPANPPPQTRFGVQNTEYRMTNHILGNLFEEGDVTIVAMPHTLRYYTGRSGEYALNTYLARQNVYDVNETPPGLLDKYVGNPVIRSKSELMDVLNRNRRVWMVSAPSVGLALSNDSEVVDYINTQFKVVYENYQTKVYLWER